MTFADLFAALETRGVLKRAASKSPTSRRWPRLGSTPRSLEPAWSRRPTGKKRPGLGDWTTTLTRTDTGHPGKSHVHSRSAIPRASCVAVSTGRRARAFARAAAPAHLRPRGRPLPGSSRNLALQAHPQRGALRAQTSRVATRHPGRVAGVPDLLRVGASARRRWRPTPRICKPISATSLTIRKRQPEWEDLFDVADLNAFVTWHGERMGHGT